jgi:uncharacterized protein
MPNLMIDQKLLEILCCPVSKTPLVMLSKAQLAFLNAKITEQNVVNVDGVGLSGQVQAGLISTDGKIIYRMDDSIPVLLPEEGIGTTQFQDFPR